jgi:hypothetical protein
MTAIRTLSRLAGAALIVAAAECAVLAAISLALTQPAQAQLFERRQRGGGGGFLGNIFGNPNYGVPFQGPSSHERAQPQVDYSRAPPAKKYEGTPTISIMVLGDSMADWLGYGLEEAFADAPEFAVLRRAKARSGLLRYEAKSDLDWWHIARDEVAKDKADYVVIMLGINDRQSIRETAAERAAEKEKKDAKEAKAGKDKAADADKSKGDDDKAEPEADDNDIVAPEPRRARTPGVIEFRTEKWEEVYGKRIDEMIAAARSKGVPVLWVGLPPIRGTRSTADTVYLNTLYRAHAEKAGIAYVDIWEGFVDEAGKFTSRGPDFEGQIRLLRAGDGVHFTKSGARKVAHYVERELRRIMSNRSTPVAMPSGAPSEQTPEQAAGPAVRPAAGPVVPLTADNAGTEELLGGASTKPVHSDPTATRVLVKGEPVAAVSGRADDFSWPRPENPDAIEPLSPTAAAARAEPAPSVKTRPGAKKPARDANDKNAKPAKPAPAKPKPVAENPPRPRQPVRQADRPPSNSGSLGSLFR